MEQIQLIIAQIFERTINLLLGQSCRAETEYFNNFGGVTLMGRNLWVDSIQWPEDEPQYFILTDEMTKVFLEEISDPSLKNILENESSQRGRAKILNGSLCGYLEKLCIKLGFPGEFLHSVQNVKSESSVIVLSGKADKIPAGGFTVRLKWQTGSGVLLWLVPDVLQKRIESFFLLEENVISVFESILEYELFIEGAEINDPEEYTVTNPEHLKFTQAFFPDELFSLFTNRNRKFSIFTEKLTVLDSGKVKPVDPADYSFSTYGITGMESLKSAWVFPDDSLKILSGSLGSSRKSTLNKLLSLCHTGLGGLIKKECIDSGRKTKFESKFTLNNKIEQYIIRIDRKILIKNRKQDREICVTFSQYIRERFLEILYEALIPPDKQLLMKRSKKNLFLSLLDLSWAVESNEVDDLIENGEPFENYLGYGGTAFLKTGARWEDFEINIENLTLGDITDLGKADGEDEVNKEKSVTKKSFKKKSSMKKSSSDSNPELNVEEENQKISISKDKTEESGIINEEEKLFEELAVLQESGKEYTETEVESMLLFEEFAGLPGITIQQFMMGVLSRHESPDDLLLALAECGKEIKYAFIKNMSKNRIAEFLHRIKKIDVTGDSSSEAQKRLLIFFLKELKANRLKLPKKKQELFERIQKEYIREQEERWQRYINNSSLNSNLEKLNNEQVSRIYDKFGRLELCLALMGYEKELRNKIFSVLPSRAGDIYFEQSAFLDKQRTENLLSYEDAVNAMEKLDRFIENQFFQDQSFAEQNTVSEKIDSFINTEEISVKADKSSDNNEDEKQDIPDRDCEDHGDKITDGLSDMDSSKKGEGTITREDAEKMLLSCHRKLHQIQNPYTLLFYDNKKAAFYSMKGLQIIRQFDFEDISAMNCFSYVAADLLGPGELALEIAKRAYELGREITGDNPKAHIIHGPYDNYMSYANVMDTYAWVLFINGFTEEALKIQERVVKYEKEREHIIHLNRMKKNRR